MRMKVSLYSEDFLGGERSKLCRKKKKKKICFAIIKRLKETISALISEGSKYWLYKNP